MKRTFLPTVVFAVALVLGWLQTVVAQDNSGVLGVILSHYSPREFATGAVPAADLDRIIQAGIRAPSAANRQPWHFTVVQNSELAKKIIPQTVEGNVLIVVSAAGNGTSNTREIIDCALAAESIYLAAQTLGYSSRIYTGTINTVNSSYKADLSLPAGHSAIILIRVGRAQSVADAVSAASSRKKTEELVTYKR